jgi:hypothetical protein
MNRLIIFGLLFFVFMNISANASCSNDINCNVISPIFYGTVTRCSDLTTYESCGGSCCGLYDGCTFNGTSCTGTTNIDCSDFHSISSNLYPECQSECSNNQNCEVGEWNNTVYRYTSCENKFNCSTFKINSCDKQPLCSWIRTPPNQSFLSWINILNIIDMPNSFFWIIPIIIVLIIIYFDLKQRLKK